MTFSSAVRAAAPGRVNLIGEHTDYNGGFVLPTAIPQQTAVELTRRGDHTVEAQSTSEPLGGTYVLGKEHARGGWLDYVQGVTWALRQAGFDTPNGFDLSITSNVPLGAGLSSSASLEVACLRAIRQAFDLQDLDDVRLAQVGQTAENDFVGAHCGIMDQMAASLADGSTALFLDTRTLEFRRIPLPADADLVVLHSGVVHEHAGGDYNTRRAECEEAARRLGVPQLRDLGLADMALIEELPDPLVRRARHVVTEDERVLQAVQALEAADLVLLGELFFASHESMRDDFEVSVPPIDLLVQIARGDAEVYGARLTGGGFGGSVVMLAHHGWGRAVGERIARTYAERSGRGPTLLVPPEPVAPE
ncbi:MAG: galactokinase [Chloroflexota bacterium]|nr:galactokinase [Chloroflexota bacterium]